jgi:hypothetical protein
MVHELTHALLMSPTFWTNPFFFTDSSGNQYSDPLYVTETNAFGLQQNYITTPLVVQVGGAPLTCARRAF